MGHARRGALTAAAVLAAALLAPSAGAAPGGGGCQLDGTANFGTGLGQTSKPFTYSFTGDLTGCQSSDAGAPATGKVQAGGTYTVGGADYTLPIATGTGGCSNSTTDGIAVADWADGTRTIIKYHTTGAAAAVALQGTVQPSLTIQPVDPLGTATTITTTRYAGGSSSGALVFEASPPDCLSPTGVTTAGIAGTISVNHS
jgi:hypothetical protein